MKHFSATDAKNKFGEMLEEINNGPVSIVKNGREIAVILSKKDFELRDTKLSKKELVQRFHEESITKYSKVYEALAK